MLLQLFLSNVLAGNNEVGILSWYSAYWEKHLSELKIPNKKLQEIDERVPVAEFPKYKIVILGTSRPKPLSDDENKAIEQYISNGGCVIITNIMPGVLKGDNPFDLSNLRWLGASRYVYGVDNSTQIMDPTSPLVAHLDANYSYSWYKVITGLGGFTTGQNIIGTENSSRVLLNKYGKGYVLYIGSHFGIYTGKGTKDADDFIRIVDFFIDKVLNDRTEELGYKSIASTAPVVKVNNVERQLTIISTIEAMAEANLLASILEKSLDKTIPVINDDFSDDVEGFSINVGLTKLVKQNDLDDVSQLASYGYRIKSIDEQNVAIVSRNNQGLRYAVYDFLHRTIGYRWFMPGELGEIIPKRSGLQIGSGLDLVENPSFITFTNAGMYGGNGGYQRSWRTTVLATHNLGNIFPPEVYGKDHPEYYPYINGRRVVPPDGSRGTWNPCISNEDLPEIALNWARDYFAKNPNDIGVSLGVNDGAGDCHCDACTALKEKYGNPYIPFYNKVACYIRKEFPDKLVGFIAYGGAATPPRNIKLEPNLYVEIASPFRNDDQVIKAWKEAGANIIGAYDYLYGTGYIVPRHYPRIIGEKWKQAYRDYNLRGAWIESFITNWFFDGPKQYVLNNLAWDINLDIDQLLDDYFQNFYGEASEPVKSFFDHIEVIYSRRPDPYHPMTDWKKETQLAEYTLEDVAILTGFLEEANRIASDPKVKKRVQLLTRSFDFSKLCILIDVYRREIEAQKIASEADVNKVIDLAQKICENLEAKEAFTLTEEEEALIIQKPADFNSYKKTLGQTPTAELAIDRAFTEISKFYKDSGRWAEAKAIWEELVTDFQGRMLEQWASTQLFLAGRAYDELDNLISNPSFEGTGPVESVPAGWGTYQFPNSECFFRWDNEVAHSGSRSIAVRKNQINGGYIKGVAVQPGERYYLSVWAKRIPAGKTEDLLTIRWQKNGQWVDQGAEASPMLNIYTDVESEEWIFIECTFTVPWNANTAIILLKGGQGQTEENGTWFDDIFLCRIL